MEHEHLVSSKAPRGASLRPIAQFQIPGAAGDAPCLSQPAGIGGQKQPQREAEGPTARRAVLSCVSPYAGT